MTYYCTYAFICKGRAVIYVHKYLKTNSMLTCSIVTNNKTNLLKHYNTTFNCKD